MWKYEETRNFGFYPWPQNHIYVCLGHKFESLWSNVAEYLRGVDMLSSSQPLKPGKSGGGGANKKPAGPLTASTDDTSLVAKGRVKLQTEFMRRNQNRDN